MKKQLTLLLIGLAALCCARSLSAQTTEERPLKRHHVTADLLGNKLAFGASYEYRFGEKINDIGIRAGLGWCGVKGVGIYQEPGGSYFFANVRANTWCIPVECNALIGPKNHHLEVGVGLVPAIITGNVEAFSYDENYTAKGTGVTISGNATVGYRYQRPQGVLYSDWRSVPCSNFLLWTIISPHRYSGLRSQSATVSDKNRLSVHIMSATFHGILQ